MSGEMSFLVPCSTALHGCHTTYSSTDTIGDFMISRWRDKLSRHVDFAFLRSLLGEVNNLDMSTYCMVQVNLVR